MAAHSIYPILSNKNGWDVEFGKGFSICYLKTKNNSLLLIIISLKSGRLSNVPSTAAVLLLLSYLLTGDACLLPRQPMFHTTLNNFKCSSNPIHSLPLFFFFLN